MKQSTYPIIIGYEPSTERNEAKRLADKLVKVSKYHVDGENARRCLRIGPAPSFANDGACGSVGRALHSYCRGQRFESAQVHHEKTMTSVVVFSCHVIDDVVGNFTWLVRSSFFVAGQLVRGWSDPLAVVLAWDVEPSRLFTSWQVSYCFT